MLLQVLIFLSMETGTDIGDIAQTNTAGPNIVTVTLPPVTDLVTLPQITVSLPRMTQYITVTTLGGATTSADLSIIGALETGDGDGEVSAAQTANLGLDVVTTTVLLVVTLPQVTSLVTVTLPGSVDVDYTTVVGAGTTVTSSVDIPIFSNLGTDDGDTQTATSDPGGRISTVFSVVTKLVTFPNDVTITALTTVYTALPAATSFIGSDVTIISTLTIPASVVPSLSISTVFNTLPNTFPAVPDPVTKLGDGSPTMVQSIITTTSLTLTPPAFVVTSVSISTITITLPPVAPASNTIPTFPVPVTNLEDDNSLVTQTETATITETITFPSTVTSIQSLFVPPVTVTSTYTRPISISTILPVTITTSFIVTTTATAISTLTQATTLSTTIFSLIPPDLSLIPPTVTSTTTQTQTATIFVTRDVTTVASTTLTQTLSLSYTSTLTQSFNATLSTTETLTIISSYTSTLTSSITVNVLSISTQIQLQPTTLTSLVVFRITQSLHTTVTLTAIQGVTSTQSISVTQTFTAIQSVTATQTVTVTQSLTETRSATTTQSVTVSVVSTIASVASVPVTVTTTTVTSTSTIGAATATGTIQCGVAGNAASGSGGVVSLGLLAASTMAHGYLAACVSAGTANCLSASYTPAISGVTAICTFYKSPVANVIFPGLVSTVFFDVICPAPVYRRHDFVSYLFHRSFLLSVCQSCVVWARRT